MQDAFDLNNNHINLNFEFTTKIYILKWHFKLYQCAIYMDTTSLDITLLSGVFVDPKNVTMGCPNPVQATQIKYEFALGWGIPWLYS